MYWYDVLELLEYDSSKIQTQVNIKKYSRSIIELGGGAGSYIQKYTYLLTSRFTGIVILFPIDSYKNQQRYYKNHKNH